MSQIRTPRAVRQRTSSPPVRRAACPTVLASLALGAFVLTSCGPKESVEWGAPQQPLDTKVTYGATSVQRFGTAPRPPTSESEPRPVAASRSFTYELPTGWVEREVTPMRRIHVGLAADPRAEITLTLLGGDGGGLAENVRRWRAQLGLGPLDGEALASLPRAELLGRPAVRFDAEGAYSGMGASGAHSGFRMLGLLAIAPEGSAFLKFTGPSDLVAAESAAFDAFAASIREAQAESAPPPEQRAPAQQPPASAVVRDGADGLAWAAPATWRKGPDRPMRTVTYLAGPNDEVECYVAQLGGDGGGVRANLDRWRGQVGAAPLDAAAFEALPRVRVLGGEAVLVEAEGSYRGMVGDAVPDALMLGAVAIQSSGGVAQRAIFVKLIGPREVAERQREAFRAFVESLEDAR